MAAVEAVVWQGGTHEAWHEVHLSQGGTQAGGGQGAGSATGQENEGSRGGGCVLANGQLVAWRQRAGSPKSVEVQEVSVLPAFSFSGARIHFPATVGHVDVKDTPSGAVLAALLPSGLLYTATLPTTSADSALEHLDASNFRTHDLAASLSRLGGATHLVVAATHALVGTQAGTLLTCTLHAEQVVIGELKEADRGLGRLWRGFVSGGSPGSPVSAVSTLQLRGSLVGVAVHADASLRVWNLQTGEQLMRSPQLLVPEEAKGLLPSGLIAAGSTPTSTQVAVVYGDPEVPRQVVCLYELEEHGWVATFSHSHTIEGHLSSLSLTPTGFDVLVTSSADTPAQHFRHEWRQSAASSLIPATRYLESRLLLEEQTSALVDHRLTNVEDLELPDFSELFLDRLFSAGVFSDEALCRTLAAKGCPVDADRHTQAELTEGVMRASKVNRATDAAVAFRCWQGFAQSYAATWANLHQPLGLATDSSGHFVAAVNSESVSVLRTPDKAAEERALVPSTSRSERGSLEQCLDLVQAALGGGAEELLTALLLQGSDAQALLDAFLSVLEGGASTSEPDRKQHRQERERVLQLRQRVQSIALEKGAWQGMFEAIRSRIAELEVPSKHDAAAVRAPESTGPGLAVGNGARDVVAARLQEAQHVLLLLGLCQRWGGQVGLAPPQLIVLQSELLPATWQLLASLLLVHNLTTIPAATGASPAAHDFSQRLSSLHIGDSRQAGSPSSPSLSLADVALSAQGWSPQGSPEHSVPAVLLENVLTALSSLRWREGQREPLNVVDRAAELAVLLLQRNQHAALKTFLRRTLDTSAALPLTAAEETGHGSSGAAALSFLYGLCCLATDTAEKQSGEEEAVAAFLQAGASVGSSDPLLTSVLRLFSPDLDSPATTASATALHRVRYLELVLSLLERYSFLAGAIRCARAALQELDAAYPTTSPATDIDLDASIEMDVTGSELALSSSQSREVHESLLWGHVFDLALQLRRYSEAYAAITSNPDANSAAENLRRLVTVLCEEGAIEVLCGHQLPYSGRLDSVHQELLRKAETSDVSARVNPYRLLYTFHSVRHNWRQAAFAMHRFAERLEDEAPVTAARVQTQAESCLAAAAALRMLPQESAWLPGESNRGQAGASKRLRGADGQPHVTIGIADLQQQHALLRARLFLLQRPQETVRRRAERTGSVAEVVWLLLEVAAFDQALSLATFCLQGTALKKELEAIFRSLAGACCRAQAQEDREQEAERSSSTRSLPSALDGFSPLLQERSIEDTTATAGTLWRSLQAYLERYDMLEYNYAFRTLVADSILGNSSGRRKQLPSWLLDMCKAGDPAALLRTLLDHGRLEEAAEVALDLLEKQKKQRNDGRAGFLATKKLSAVWLPYMLLGQLQKDLQALTESNATPRRTQLQAALQRELQQHVNKVVEDSSTLYAVA